MTRTNPRQARAAFIFVTIALDAVGIGLIIPVLPDLLKRFISDPTELSHVFGYFISIYALMQFIASPLLGSLADQYGRRPILLMSLLGAGLDYLVMTFAPTLTILFLGRLISGLTGASMTVAMASTADISDDSNRSKNFGVIGAAWGLGFILGPALGGLLGANNPHLPFVGAAVLNLLNFAFGVFILPESLPPEKRRALVWRDLNPAGSLIRTLKTSPVFALLLVYILFQLAGQTHPSVWTLYVEHRFGWTAAEVGASLAFVGLTSALAQGLLTGPATKHLGEGRAVVWGSLGYAASFLMFALVTQGWMIYVALFFSSIFGVAPPALQALISHQTPPEKQGELQGSLVSLMSLCAIVTPIWSTRLFAHFSKPDAAFYFPGAPYAFGALMCVLAWVIVVTSKSKPPRHPDL